MGSKRNHAVSSRKTHKLRMYGAYKFLKGSISWKEKQRMKAILRGEPIGEDEFAYVNSAAEEDNA